jgi:hypothetical protein
MIESKAVIVELGLADGPLAVREAEAVSYECDGCGERFEGEPAGSGLFMWTRGDELRFEEPPLCQQCAQNVTLDALTRWDAEEEEEG